MKRWLALLLVFALFAAACGGDDDTTASDGDQSTTTDDGGDDGAAAGDDGDDGAAAGDDGDDGAAAGDDGDGAAAESVTLNILVEGGGFGTQQGIAAAFEEATGHKVEFTELPYAGVFERLSAEIASGDVSFDVATVDVVWLPAFADHIEPLDDFYTDEVIGDLSAALVDRAQIDGTFVGVPTWANTEIIFYRKSLFEDPAEQAAFEEEYGYPLAPPTTWQEFQDMAIFFTRDTDGDGEIDLWGTDVKGGVHVEWLAHALQAGAPAAVYDGDEIVIDDAAHIEALEYHTDLHCVHGVSPSNVLEIDWGAAQNLFNQGQTALFRFWGHAYRFVPEDAPVFGDVGVAPMIAGSAGAGAIPGPWYNVIPSTGDNVEVARQFVEFAYENNVMSIDSPLALAARNSAFEEYVGREGYEHFEPLLETLADATTIGRPPREDWPAINDEILTPVVQEALECNREPAEILADAADALTEYG